VSGYLFPPAVCLFRSQIHEYGNWNWFHTASFLEVHISDFLCIVEAPKARAKMCVTFGTWESWVGGRMSCAAGGAQRRSWCGGWGRTRAAAAAQASQRHLPHRSLASASPATLITHPTIIFYLTSYIKTFCVFPLYSTYFSKMTYEILIYSTILHCVPPSL